jgi:hypothetical protein
MRKGRIPKTLAEKFWPNVSPEPNTGCWLWTASVMEKRRGYGQIQFGGTLLKAHRVSWELHHGAGSAKGLFVCHHCDVPSCVNPDHLFLGTNTDNVHDMVAKHRHCGQKKTHCPRGHPYDKISHRGNGRPFRRCKCCSTELSRKRKWKGKAVLP